MPVSSVPSRDQSIKPAIGVSVESTPASPPGGAASSRSYSLALVGRPGLECDVCKSTIGTGPVGHLDGNPICDRCLADGCRDLGAVLSLIAATRTHAVFVQRHPDQRAERLELFGGFVESFARLAQAWGRIRVVAVPGLGDEEPS